MPRPEPTNIIEFNARFQENQKISGWGLNVLIHLPCPFCTASDFMVYPIMDTRTVMEKGSVCERCKRGCRAIFTDAPGMVSFTMVQTEGPDQPEWLEPKMPRETDL